jgi:DNA replication protein DnaC
MDEDQQSVFNLAINGHNLLITGQGGTGKSFLVKIIIKHLRTIVISTYYLLLLAFTGLLIL